MAGLLADLSVLAVDDEFALLLVRQLPASGNRLVLRGEGVALLAVDPERPSLAALLDRRQDLSQAVS